MNASDDHPGDGADAARVRRPAHGVERRAIAMWALRALAVWGAALTALLVAYGLWESARPWLLAPAVAAGAMLLVRVAVEPWWRFRVHRWELTEHAAYATTGWLVQEWRVSPVSRIQTVDAVRGPIEQLLGLSTLRVTTASSYGAIKVQGLDRAVAEEASTRLAKAAELTEGDAT
ncbi:PH domain-containing protein [Georgenia sp. Z1491]|uniref:PH domain-containing protein n=1 Tax=Georgenia sp. Z1491 TaxID=3416707 RepID=UPI003CF64A7E